MQSLNNDDIACIFDGFGQLPVVIGICARRMKDQIQYNNLSAGASQVIDQACVNVPGPRPEIR